MGDWHEASLLMKFGIDVSIMMSKTMFVVHQLEVIAVVPIELKGNGSDYDSEL